MKFVRIGSFSSRMQAEIIAGLLQGSGIRVQIRSDDAAGLDPALALVNGVDVLVPEDQLSFAKELIEDVGKS